MPKLHLKCVDGKHIEYRKPPEDYWESGHWPLTEEEADRLVGGTVMLHETKKKLSYFGGEVIGFHPSVAADGYPGRFVLHIRSKAECKGLPWRGRNDVNAWFGGLLDD